MGLFYSTAHGRDYLSSLISGLPDGVTLIRLTKSLFLHRTLPALPMHRHAA
ncbi:hypothetical protein KCP70_11535 [Salmonella enterica subsp. enterica]|nr:hypothetical protein KCP70_11535 [Salmonella enterica subsp. enterica]